MKQKSNTNQINILLLYIIYEIIICFTVCITSCGLFTIKRHHPTIVSHASFLFEDSNGNCYFSIPQFPGIYKYNLANTDAPLYYENVYLSLRSEDYFNPGESTSNSKYLIISENSSLKDNNYSKIGILDKSLSLVDSFSMGNGVWVKHLECTDNYLYFTVYNPTNNVYSLKRFSFISKEINDLLDNVQDIKTYFDDDVRLFFYGDKIPFYFRKYSQQTELFQNAEKDKAHIFSNDLELTYSNKTIIINNRGNVSSFVLDKEFNYFYGRSYLIDKILLFGVYKYEPDPKCLIKDYSYYPSTCICGLKESYLFAYDISLNTLSLIKEYPKGSFLIDYDLDGAKYYYNGYLYLNDEKYQQCEIIVPGEIDTFSIGNEYRPSQANKCFYLSFKANKFFGI